MKYENEICADSIVRYIGSGTQFLTTNGLYLVIEVKGDKLIVEGKKKVCNDIKDFVYYMEYKMNDIKEGDRVLVNGQPGIVTGTMYYSSYTEYHVYMQNKRKTIEIKEFKCEFIEHNPLTRNDIRIGDKVKYIGGKYYHYEPKEKEKGFCEVTGITEEDDHNIYLDNIDLGVNVCEIIMILPEPILIKSKDLEQFQKTEAILKELPEAFGDDFKCLVCGEKIGEHAQLKKVVFSRKTVKIIYNLWCHTPERQTEEIIFIKKKSTWSVDQKCLPQFELRKKHNRKEKITDVEKRTKLFIELENDYGSENLVCPICGIKITRDGRSPYVTDRGRLKSWFRRRPMLLVRMYCHENSCWDYIRFEKLKNGTWRIHALKI